MNCQYVRDYYGVPAQIGRRVIAYGQPGIIVKDRGHYIDINLDKDKPGVVKNYHPVDGIQYLEMDKIRQPSRGRARYLRYLAYSECFHSFIEFCRWDAEPERSWNGGYKA